MRSMVPLKESTWYIINGLESLVVTLLSNTNMSEICTLHTNTQMARRLMGGEFWLMWREAALSKDGVQGGLVVGLGGLAEVVQMLISNIQVVMMHHGMMRETGIESETGIDASAVSVAVNGTRSARDVEAVPESGGVLLDLAVGRRKRGRSVLAGSEAERKIRIKIGIVSDAAVAVNARGSEIATGIRIRKKNAQM